MDDIDEKLEEYHKKFGDVFPTIEYDLTGEELIEFIDECLLKNKKAQDIAPLDKGAIY
jgi:hypothetical protein